MSVHPPEEVALHEAAHAVVAVVLGLPVLRVQAHGRPPTPGSCEWLSRDALGSAAVRLAPRVAGLPAAGCTTDEREAVDDVVGLDFIDAKRLARSALDMAGERALYALARALEAAEDRTLPGVAVERIVREAMS